MIIDLHNHTSRYSQCSIIDPDELIKFYIKAKIDGICITEHNYLWPKKEQTNIQKKYAGKIKIFYGIELSTDMGHILVFGRDINDIQSVYYFEELEKKIDRENCVLIWAHPFRWGIQMNSKININLFNKFDALELYNGNLTEKEINYTKKIINKYNINNTGGSDTHSFKMALKYATYFKDNITKPVELIKNIKYGQYKAVIL